ARTRFRYLRESPGRIEIVPGDGRLSLARESGPPYDLLVIDAFSGDSIPTHLLTREAFALYFARLAPAGILAVHITNHYVDLEGVVRAAADDSRRTALRIASPGDSELGTRAAVWILIAANPAAIEQLQPAASALTARPRLWTDEYSDILRVLR
ncbi:MAG: fused MFS/spermidine synthase, partial [Acidobacteriota bacterium]|nr:fused MFS/spermidine synthase [Acidobacteriota bacterium]